MKITIAVMSDPRGGEESLGRVFNALTLASEAQRDGDDVKVVFHGTGTRWPAELSKLGHPARELYELVRPNVVGANRACAAVFGVTDAPMVDNSLWRHLAADRQLVIF